jgi:hypothetical protein
VSAELTGVVRALAWSERAHPRDKAGKFRRKGVGGVTQAARLVGTAAAVGGGVLPLRIPSGRGLEPGLQHREPASPEEAEAILRRGRETARRRRAGLLPAPEQKRLRIGGGGEQLLLTTGRGPNDDVAPAPSPHPSLSPERVEELMRRREANLALRARLAKNLARTKTERQRRATSLAMGNALMQILQIDDQLQTGRPPIGLRNRRYVALKRSGG